MTTTPKSNWTTKTPQLKKSRTFLVFSDLHAHDWRDFAFPTDDPRGLTTRQIDALDVIDMVGKLANQLAVDEVVFCGDLLHRKRIIDTPMYGHIARGLADLASFRPLHLVVGNHDLATAAGAHCLTALGFIPGVTVHDSPATEFGVGYVPYYEDPALVKEAYQWVHKEGAQLIFGHLGVAGATVGEIEHQPLEPVAVTDLPHVSIVSGHYHRPQQVGQVAYVGAPITHVRGEPADPLRGFLLVAREPGVTNYERIPYPGPNIVAVHYAQWPDTLEGQYADYTFPANLSADDAREACYALGARGVSVHPEPITRSSTPRLVVGPRPAEERGTVPGVLDLLRPYVESQTADKAERAALLKLGKEALDACH